MKVKAAIATIGERTTDLAVHLVRRQVDSIRVVDNMSRAEAVQARWEFGLSADVLVMVDADVLVCPGMVDRMIDTLLAMNSDRVVGKCLSKFRGLRTGGFAVYNSRCLQGLLHRLPEFKDSIRPESNTSRAVLGNKMNKVGLMTAMHEYELDYNEIYIRYVFQRLKHPDEMAHRLHGFKHQAEKDDDFKAVVQALTGQEFNMGKKEPITNLEAMRKAYRL